MISAFLAAQPKSASTHIAFSLARYFDGVYGAVNIYGNNGIEAQDIHPPTLEAAMMAKERLVVKPHCQATPNNVTLLGRHGIKVIVTVRDVHDSVLSMKEHFDHIIDPEHSEHMAGDFVPMPIGIPFHQDTYKALQGDAKMEYIIDIFAPWILHFQHGWSRVKGDVLTLDYNDFMGSKHQRFMELLRFLGQQPEEIDSDKAYEAIQPNDLRFNNASVGRGREVMTEAQAKRIDEMKWRIYAESKNVVSR